MRVALAAMACVFMVGCAATPAVDQKTVAREPSREAVREDPARERVPDAVAIEAGQACVIVKLRGAAHMHDVDDRGFIVLREGDRIPLGKIFYLEPKTTMKLDQGEEEGIFLYSKDHDAYYRLESSR